MAGTVELLRQQAVAQQEAIAGIERLLGEEIARLHSAKHDVAGRGDSVYVLNLCLAELVRVVEELAAENAELRAQKKPRSRKSSASKA